MISTNSATATALKKKVKMCRVVIIWFYRICWLQTNRCWFRVNTYFEKSFRS